jgi:hypothetical protein
MLHFPLMKAPVNFLSLLVLLPLFMLGCNTDSGDEGVRLEVLLDAAGDPPSGVDPDTWPDAFLTPIEYAVAIKRATLLGPDSASYVIFDDTDFNLSHLLETDSLDSPVLFEVETNGSFPTECPCSFDRIEYELAYVEMVVPVYEGDAAVNRRFRLYTADYTDTVTAESPGVTVAVGDVLVEDPVGSGFFKWIDLEDGSYDSLDTPPVVHLQAPQGVYTDLFSPPFTVTLSSPLEVPEDPEGLYTPTMAISVGQRFFYDETETDTTAETYTRFDRFSDGALNLNDPVSHFFPLFPHMTAAGSSEESGL